MGETIPQIGDQSQAVCAPTWGTTRNAKIRNVPTMGRTGPFANNLKRLREVSGMTQEQAAERFGLSKGGYIKIEDGDRGLKTDRIARAAEIYRVDPAVIIGQITEE